MSQKTAEALKVMEQGIQDVMDSQNFQNYLRFSSSFRHYSLNNTLLIYSQTQGRATLCAPYREWQKKHRHVKRGEHGLMIIAPHSYKKKSSEGDEKDQLGFHVAYTYDISQTEPDDESGEIPEICHNLTEDIPDASLLDTLVSLCPCPVFFEPVEGSANGYFSPTENKIVVDNTNSTLQQTKTYLHEWSHQQHFQKDPDFKNRTREERETIAESCAFTVCSYLGLSTDEYSFPYLATYSSGKELPELKKFMNLIKTISDEIIDKIETAIAEPANA